MRRVRFTCRLTDGAVDAIGYLTATPGLLVTGPIGGRCAIHHPTPCWRVTHAPTGRRFPCCWERRAAAFAFAEHAGALGTWQITGARLERRLALPYVIRYLVEKAAEADAGTQPVFWEVAPEVLPTPPF